MLLYCKLIKVIYHAAVAESADARDLKSLGGNTVRVQFPSAAPAMPDCFSRASLIIFQSKSQMEGSLCRNF